MKIGYLLLLVSLTLSLVACGKTTSTPSTIPVTAAPTDSSSARWNESPQSDGQGAVTVEITPLNLNAPSDTLEFSVSLNTHSVNLSMDLAERATLTTDTGRTVQGILWDAPSGGHHVSGTLIFPATFDGQPLLEGATLVTLYIKNVDANLRLFNWRLVR